jgi:hypothetical protein
VEGKKSLTSMQVCYIQLFCNKKLGENCMMFLNFFSLSKYTMCIITLFWQKIGSAPLHAMIMQLFLNVKNWAWNKNLVKFCTFWWLIIPQIDNFLVKRYQANFESKSNQNYAYYMKNIPHISNIFLPHLV